MGPTGSGKTSTMYTMIHQLNSEQVNLMTLEDPVEYNIDGINQVQINEKTGMTFASGLRSILRQDPDIIAVGEIRDGETAEIAMRAAITGHLVLSTVHTNDALSTVERLKDIGVPNYLIAGALNGVISQRLVRTICPDCKQAYDPTAQEDWPSWVCPPTASRSCSGARAAPTALAGAIGGAPLYSRCWCSAAGCARPSPRAWTGRTCGRSCARRGTMPPFRRTAAAWSRTGDYHRGGAETGQLRGV
ncbi:MAG: ATPase, T2SS/T4P/T4SS family [Lawsonibacter sp.]